MQVAIITGSGQGLGAAAAKLFAQHGARVVVSDIDSAKAQQVMTETVARSTMIRGWCVKCLLLRPNDLRTTVR